MNNYSSWREVIEDEAKKPYFKKVMQYVDRQRTVKNIYPLRKEMFSCFQKCPLSKVKVVIIGQDPYYGEGQAHGMSFSVKEGVKIPPSLQNIFKELKEDIGIKELPQSGNLERWARQGVLLMNTSWSVEKGKPASHSNIGWMEFTENILKVLNNLDKPLVFLLWGSHAQKVGKIITNPIHLKIETSHPSPLSAHRGFFGSKPFSKTNEFLQKNSQDEINWSIKRGAI